MIMPTTGPRAATFTQTCHAQLGSLFTEGPAVSVAAVAAGDFDRATLLTERLRAGARQLHHSVVRDALATGLDWWQLGELMGLHPQAAFDAYANLLDHATTPARQRPALAVMCTAGLVGLHDMRPEHGIDLDDLTDLAPGHSLTLDPTVLRLRAAAATLGEDIWITARPPTRH